jgi:hypothetical protein
MSTHRKRSKKKFFVLLVIIFSHILPIIVSAFYDQATHANHNVKLSELNYWWWFFTWWSAWASLLTIPWAIYKLFTLKRKKSSFSEQIWDITVAETNFLSGVIFCCGGFYLTIHSTFKNPEITYPLVGNVESIYIWLLYNFFWHVLAPGLAFYYFWKYCQVDKIAKRKSVGSIVNLFNPTIYLLYTMLRPLIGNFSKPSSALPHHYPPDYPYPPFFWIAGEYASGSEKKLGKSTFLFWSWQPDWLPGLVWLAIIIISCYIIFSLLFHFLIKYKKI